MKLPAWRSQADNDDSALVERLDLLIETQRQTNVLLERLVAQKGSEPAEQRIRRRADPTTSARQRGGIERRSQATSQPSDRETRPGLHEEIEAVLREAGHPLPANAIAERIRERGKYTPPRSSKPLSGSNVNSRIANPTYRNRFIRRDDGIWLASLDAPSSAG